MHTFLFLTNGPAGNPKCGDVWELSDGRRLVIDYTSPFQVGATFCSGEQVGWNYREGVATFLRVHGARLIGRYSWPWPPEGTQEHPTKEDGVQFIATKTS